MNTASIDSPTTNFSVTTAPGRFQFSLRAMFFVVTFAAISLAALPKNENAIVGLLFVPQFGLIAWSMWRGLVRSESYFRAEGVRDQLIKALAYLIGLVMPASVVLALLTESFPGGDTSMLTIFLGTLVLGPVVLTLMLLRIIPRGHLPLALLHSYNTVISIVPAGLMCIFMNMPRC